MVPLVSPATSRGAVTPCNMPVPSPTGNSLPCFPSLASMSSSRACDKHKEGSELPATAALERVMLKQRRSPSPQYIDQVLDDEQSIEFSHAFDEEDYCEDVVPSPRHVKGLPPCDISRRVSLSSPKSSYVSIQDGTSVPFNSPSYQRMMLPNNTSSPNDILASPCKVPPQQKKDAHQAAGPTVNQITEALSRM